ncbi:MAG: DUF421 domain-containing protein [Syntrophomonadaceae bacterium]
MIIRTLILFTTTVVLLRLTGKRQIGQLQPYELVVIIMISELASIPMQNTGIPLLYGIIPVTILVMAEITLSLISLKSERARGLICGTPSVLIENSRILEMELRRLRININDLLEQLRQKGVPDVADVEYAILETSGQLSLILKSDKRPLQPGDMDIWPDPEGLPVTLVIDGRVIEPNLAAANRDMAWLQRELANSGVRSHRDIFFATLDSRGQLYYQVKNAQPIRT